MKAKNYQSISSKGVFINFWSKSSYLARITIKYWLLKAILCLTVLYFVFSRKISTVESIMTPIVAEESTMSSTVPIHKRVWSKKYLSSNLAASSSLGNHLFELSALLALSRKLGRTPTFFIKNSYYDQILKDTDVLIPGLLDHFLIINSTVPLTVKPTEFHTKCCVFDDPDKLKNVTDEYLHIKGTHFQSWKYFSRLRNELVSYLRQPTSKHSDLPKSSETSKVTCVHIRRADFLGSGFHVPDDTFILKSMQFVEQKELRKKHLNMTTVFFGDDFPFLENLRNQSFTLSNGRLKDLKLESFISRDTPEDSILYARHNCDVVLFTSPHSAFGWWLGYLSKGNQVYYTDLKYTEDVSNPSESFNPDDYFPTHWIPFKYDEYDNNTVVEAL